MKTIKETIILLMMMGFFMPSIIKSASAQEDVAKAKVYYFHNTKRCETCLAIENEAKNALTENFSIQMEEGLVIFETYNFDDDKNSEIIKKLKVEGQSVFVIKNGKKKDLTEKGMLYARINPDKFKQIVKEALGDI